MNKRMQAKITAGMLSKINAVIENAKQNNNKEEITRLNNARNYMIVSLLCNNMGIIGYNDDFLIIALSDDLIKISLKEIKTILPENKLNELLKQNLKTYQEEIKHKSEKQKTEPEKQEKQSEINPINQIPSSDGLFDLDFSMDLNEFEIKETKKEIEKKEKQEVPKRKLTTEELLKKFAEEQNKYSETNQPEPEILSFNEDQTEIQEDQDDMDLYNVDLFSSEPSSKEDRNQNDKIDNQGTSINQKTNPTLEENKETIITEEKVVSVPDEQKGIEEIKEETGVSSNDNAQDDPDDDYDFSDLLFYNPTSDPEPGDKQTKKEPDYTDDFLLFGAEDESEKEKTLLDNDNSELFGNAAAEPVSEINSPNELENEYDFVFEETPETKETVDQEEKVEEETEEIEDENNEKLEEFIIQEDDQNELEEQEEQTEDEFLAELNASKLERQQVFLNLLMSVEKDEEDIEVPEENVEDKEEENKFIDNYELLYKYEKSDFSYDTLNKDEYLADLYDFEYDGKKYRVVIFPIYIPKNDGSTSICMFVINDESIAAEISSGNFKVADANFDDFNFFATGKIENRHFITSLNIKHDGKILNNVKKTCLRPDPNEYGGYGHNILRIDVADTMHVFPIDLGGEDNSAIVILKKDYGIDKLYETYYLKDGHIENVQTDDGDYTLNTEWKNDEFSIEAKKKIVTRRKETLF